MRREVDSSHAVGRSHCSPISGLPAAQRCRREEESRRRDYRVIEAGECLWSLEDDVDAAGERCKLLMLTLARPEPTEEEVTWKKGEAGGGGRPGRCTEQAACGALRVVPRAAPPACAPPCPAPQASGRTTASRHALDHCTKRAGGCSRTMRTCMGWRTSCRQGHATLRCAGGGLTHRRVAGGPPASGLVAALISPSAPFHPAAGAVLPGGRAHVCARQAVGATGGQPVGDRRPPAPTRSAAVCAALLAAGRRGGGGRRDRLTARCVAASLIQAAPFLSSARTVLQVRIHCVSRPPRCMLWGGSRRTAATEGSGNWGCRGGGGSTERCRSWRTRAMAACASKR